MILVNLQNKKKIQIYGLIQYDFGQVLEIHGIDTDKNIIEVHFAIEHAKEALIGIANVVNGVIFAKIPDELLKLGSNLYAYVYLSSKEYGKTVRTIKLYVDKRAKPVDYQEPEHEDLFRETIEIVDGLVSETRTIVEDTVKNVDESVQQAIALKAAQNLEESGNIVRNVLETQEIQDVIADTEKAIAIAKKSNSAKGYKTYEDLITELNEADSDKYVVGQSMLIVTLNVPDMWISGIDDTSVPYTYVDDTTIVAELQSFGYIQAGHYRLSMLETLKQDLSNYVTNEDYATHTKGGVVKIGLGVRLDSNYKLTLATPPEGSVKNKASTEYAVTLNHIDLTTKEGIVNNALSLTTVEQQSAKSWLGVNDIKHIDPQEDGTYFCHIADMDTGIYFLPANTIIQYTPTGKTRIVPEEAYLLIMYSTTYNSNKFLLFGYNSIIGAYGFESNNSGYWGGINWQNIVYTDNEQTISGEKIFTKQPLITEDQSDLSMSGDEVVKASWVQELLKNSKSIKSIAPQEDGSYYCHIIEMDDGLYVLPKGTVMQYHPTSTIRRTISADNAILLITTSISGERIFELYGNAYGHITYGYENETYGICNIKTVKYMAQINANQKFTGLNTFEVTPIITEEQTDYAESSTNVPTMAWVQNLLGSGRGIKYLTADENGEYSIYLYDMSDGIYYIPYGTKVVYRASGTSFTIDSPCYMQVAKNPSDGYVYGYYTSGNNIGRVYADSESRGKAEGISISNASNIARNETFSGIKTFSKQPIITAAQDVLTLEDNAIVTAGWVKELMREHGLI